MSEIDSAIAVGGTLLGAVVAYYFEERRFFKQKTLEISLQPLVERRAALKEVYLAMVNCFNRTVPPHADLSGRALGGEPSNHREKVARLRIWYMGR